MRVKRVHNIDRHVITREPDGIFFVALCPRRPRPPVPVAVLVAHGDAIAYLESAVFLRLERHRQPFSFGFEQVEERRGIPCISAHSGHHAPIRVAVVFVGALIGHAPIVPRFRAEYPTTVQIDAEVGGYGVPVRLELREAHMDHASSCVGMITTAVPCVHPEIERLIQTHGDVDVTKRVNRRTVDPRLDNRWCSRQQQPRLKLFEHGDLVLFASCRGGAAVVFQSSLSSTAGQ